MSERVTKSVAQEQQEQKIETRTAVKRIAGFTIVAQPWQCSPSSAAWPFTRKAKTRTSTR